MAQAMHRMYASTPSSTPRAKKVIVRSNTRTQQTTSTKDIHKSQQTVNAADIHTNTPHKRFALAIEDFALDLYDKWTHRDEHAEAAERNATGKSQAQNITNITINSSERSPKEAKAANNRFENTTETHIDGTELSPEDFLESQRQTLVNHAIEDKSSTVNPEVFEVSCTGGEDIDSHEADSETKVTDASSNHKDTPRDGSASRRYRLPPVHRPGTLTRQTSLIHSNHSSHSSMQSGIHSSSSSLGSDSGSVPDSKRPVILTRSNSGAQTISLHSSSLSQLGSDPGSHKSLSLSFKPKLSTIITTETGTVSVSDDSTSTNSRGRKFVSSPRMSRPTSPRSPRPLSPMLSAALPLELDHKSFSDTEFLSMEKVF